MAKGNDGNFLQHSVELSAASHLAALSADRSLHISITHGMAPFEACGTISAGQRSRYFETSLQEASLPPQENESLLVHAYRKTNASREHYPNTGELLASLLSRERMSGGIAEVIPEKYTALCRAWAGTLVRPVNASWRDA